MGIQPDSIEPSDSLAVLPNYLFSEHFEELFSYQTHFLKSLFRLCFLPLLDLNMRLPYSVSKVLKSPWKLNLKT